MKLNAQPEPLPPGLYIVATPIGNLRDISARALATLASVDVIACEDTRVTGKLLHHYSIATKTLPYHDHNAARTRPELLARIQSGARIALVSDAGTPLISDPGYKLVREAQDMGLHVSAIPGPSSVMAALCMSGLPTDRFLFLGFLPTAAAQARSFLEPYASVPATLVIFESAKRVAATLSLLHELLGEREACLTRELTKLYEEARRAPLAELAAHYAAAPEPKGEVVLVIAPPPPREISDEALDTALHNALSRLKLKDAVAEVAAMLDVPRNRAYARALELRKESDDDA